MGYSLIPRNKKVEPLRLGSSYWSWMVREGIGLPAGNVPAVQPGRYLMINGAADLSSCRGRMVTARQAKLMGLVAGWIADAQDALRHQFDGFSPDDQKRMSEGRGVYRLPVRGDIVDKLRAFAEWAPKSGGFRVR